MAKSLVHLHLSLLPASNQPTKAFLLAGNLRIIEENKPSFSISQFPIQLTFPWKKPPRYFSPSSLLLLFFPTTTTQASSPEPLFAAAALTLTNSDFLSMALTLHLASTVLRLPSFPTTAATISVPSDAAFSHFGPLPFSLLQYHILPSRLPLQHLTTLPLAPLYPPSILIPHSQSLHPLFHLPQLSLNDVIIANTAIFDDNSLHMLAINNFFSSSSLLVPEIVASKNEPFVAISDVLKSKDFSIIAIFPKAPLANEFIEETKFIVFAPIDEAIVKSERNINDYSSIFQKHIVPRLIL